jgi:hypothetical protein
VESSAHPAIGLSRNGKQASTLVCVPKKLRSAQTRFLLQPHYDGTPTSMFSRTLGHELYINKHLEAEGFERTLAVMGNSKRNDLKSSSENSKLAKRDD